MLITVAVAATDATPSLFVPVVVALVGGLITGSAGIVVALISTSRQARQAALDRAAAVERAEAEYAEARAREDRVRDARDARIRQEQSERSRIERAEVLEDIVAEIAHLAARYTELRLKAEAEAGIGADRIPHPSRSGLMRALSRLTTRLAQPELFRASSDVLVAGAAGLTVSKFHFVFGLLQRRLDSWFLGEVDTNVTLITMQDDARRLRGSHIPTVSTPIAE